MPQSKNMSKVLVYALLVALVVAAGIFGAFVWPTLYRYDHMNLKGTVLPVRIHRVSGKTEVLYPSGWQSTDHDKTSEPVTTPLPATELQKLHGNASFYDTELACSIYNGTSYRVNEVIVHVQVTDTGQASPVVDRDYRLKNSYFTDPLETGIFRQYLGFSPQKDPKWS